ncbi:helix-turn-helix domain-containing protein [Streptomyces koyangensis]|uniref:Helix-turn-helix domain-containing protein n=1 Tax=Streptomyces koyangensis TaxID=188770 RepID=A0ABX7EFY3_9ACTN|nr:helix-turn-helix transcriptional regulator [Streptomyces koyangensis]QDD59458.1 helix-turn-helix domain-containing protein [Streptomyces albidoflavus]QRF03692.1 helix-turn-helix domain-containing protein [Streptomyces koyangensis]WTD04351.1 helix-turn-helix domain-containing protein [Streptomyces albidoflavus]
MVNRKELNPEASPHAAFGAKLRVVREGLGLTQDQLGNEMGYTCGHISSVETGRKVPTLRFSRQADRALGTANTEDAFERQWREIRQGSLLEGAPEYMGCEARSAEIRLYEVGVVPGLLQTPEYALTLAEGAVLRGSITEEQAAERVQMIADRQDALKRRTPPMVFVVLDESCLRRPVGEPAIMNAQLEHLMEFADRPNTMVQVAPFDLGARRPFDLPIYILTMPDRQLMSYAESAQRGHLDRESTSVLPLLTAYHQLQALALSQAASVAMISQLRKGTP